MGEKEEGKREKEESKGDKGEGKGSRNPRRWGGSSFTSQDSEAAKQNGF